MEKKLLCLTVLLFCGCLGMPESITPVRDFDLTRYLGTWYEIARLDHSFERGLEQVTAAYSLRDDGGVRVVNRGFSVKKNAWRQAEGRAYFVREPDEGYLKVSFFGPFFGSYVIFGLDRDNYQYAFVSGSSTSYLWLLSRTPAVSDTLMSRFLQKAVAYGFDTEGIIFVNQKPGGGQQPAPLGEAVLPPDQVL